MSAIQQDPSGWTKPLDTESAEQPVLEGMWPGLPDDLRLLMFSLCEYLWMTDEDHFTATLAAAVAKARSDFDPLWLMLIAPSSSGKGEALQLLRYVRDAQIDDITVAGLLGKGGTGALVELNDRDSLAVISDFSTLLGDNRVSGAAKSDVFNALRTIYDGSFRRDIHPAPVSWNGRLSLIAACTPAIDDFSAHADSLGTRWLYFRMRDRSATEKREVVHMVMQREKLHEQRASAAKLAAEIIYRAQARVSDVTLSPELDELVADTATLVAYGRASVPRDYRREVDGVVTTEDPGRVAGQLRMLGIGLAALDVAPEVVTRIVRRAALSSMPQARARVIDVLSRATEPLSGYRIAKSADLDIKVAQRALEDWSLVHIVDSAEVTGEKGLPATAWALTPDGAAIAAAGLDNGSD